MHSQQHYQLIQNNMCNSIVCQFIFSNKMKHSLEKSMGQLDYTSRKDKEIKFMSLMLWKVSMQCQNNSIRNSSSANLGDINL